MFPAIALFLPLSVCLAAPTVTEDQLRSLIQPLLDSSQSLTIPANAPPLFASLAAVSPLNNLELHAPHQTANVNTDQANHNISPANQQMAQLNLAGGLTSLIKTALGSLNPPTSETSPSAFNPNIGNNPGATGALFPNNFPNTFPNGGNVQPMPAPMPALPNNNNNNNNMFNPLSFLFPGMGGSGGGPFGMLMPSLMMRMLEGLMELF